MIVPVPKQDQLVMEYLTTLKPNSLGNSCNPNNACNCRPLPWLEQQSNTGANASTKKTKSTLLSTPSTRTSQRRAIFDNFWKKSSSIKDCIDNVSTSEAPERRSGTAKVKPSYLGIYSFVSPSVTSPNPSLMRSVNNPSDKSLYPSPVPPKSILRRNHRRSIHPIVEEESVDNMSRSVSVASGIKLASGELHVPPLFHIDENEYKSKAPSCGMRSHSVHFDPTVTIREVVTYGKEDDPHSKWFNEEELKTFFKEAIHICHASAINSIKTYSPQEVARCHAKAEQLGIKDPVVCSSLPEARALFAEPILHVTDENAIVHDRSAIFFNISYKMIRRVLIVESSLATSKILVNHVLSMFPHVAVDQCSNGEDAMSRMTLDSSGKIVYHEYDIVIVDENCYNSLERLEHKKDDDSDHDKTVMTGSNFLQRVNAFETSNCSSQSPNSLESNSDKEQRVSLRIGVSANMSEDCDCLRRGGADLLWAKPPPKPSNHLRNQLLNTLLNKRGKSIFICGC